jgi:hypothetical protein
MKKIGIFLILTVIWFRSSGQENKNENLVENQNVISSDTNDNPKVVIGNNLLSVEEGKDAVKVRLGDRGLNILETLEGSKVKFERYTNDDLLYQEDEKDKKSSSSKFRKGFKGHWAGIEFGFNNYLTAGNSQVMPADIYYMTLHSSKSNNFNLNFSQLSLGFTRHIGIVTGLGFNWNNYRFDGNNNIVKGANGIIEELDPGSILEKSKLTTVYLTLPLVLEMQIPVENHHLNIGGGFIGAIKTGSHTKMVFQDGDKVKSNGDFSLNLIRCGLTARIGYGNFQIYATNYMTPLFKTGKGPGGYNLYPFEIGFAFTSRD